MERFLFYPHHLNNYNSYNSATTQSAAKDFRSKTESSTKMFNVSVGGGTLINFEGLSTELAEGKVWGMKYE